ncbi:hypothetical protein F511_22839 [Dorcoceras hygrometricum]|uniref:Uncharacterized protein n=1 Tax=Dorcoceras hygrometricum TaxID=472368 RepID=A0A2Z7D5R4_9LAMI|nr:hypothetical protein F511_22839 [Dorcoceras hygrometricum]
MLRLVPAGESCVCVSAGCPAEADVNAGQLSCSAKMKRRRFVVATGCPAARDFHYCSLRLVPAERSVMCCCVLETGYPAAGSEDCVSYAMSFEALFSRELFRRIPVVSGGCFARARSERSKFNEPRATPPPHAAAQHERTMARAQARAAAHGRRSSGAALRESSRTVSRLAHSLRDGRSAAETLLDVARWTRDTAARCSAAPCVVCGACSPLGASCARVRPCGACDFVAAAGRPPLRRVSGDVVTAGLVSSRVWFGPVPGSP